MAVELSEYAAGIDGWVKTCAKEDALAALGETEKLSVEQSPGDGDIVNVIRVSGKHVTCTRPALPWRDHAHPQSELCECQSQVAAVVT